MLKRFRTAGPAPDPPLDRWGGLRQAVGGLWEEMGAAQFDFMVGQGLEPHHLLVDIGCGNLRGGVRFVPYLKPGHYYGVDQSQAMLDGGLHELEMAGVRERRPTLRCTDRFEIDWGVQFDFALAQSVFTHVPINSILRCLLNVERVLAPQGRFYATFLENPAGKNSLEPVSHPQPDGPPVITTMDADPYHHDLATFQWACGGTSLGVDYIGEWGSLRGQKMLVFTHRDAGRPPA